MLLLKIMNRSSSPANPLAIILSGASAVGSYLADSLLSQNCRVICFDELNPLKENNINHLLDNRNFEVLSDFSDYHQQADYVFCLESKWSKFLENDQLSQARWLFLDSKFNDNVFDQARNLDLDCRFACADGIFGPRMDLNRGSWTAKLVSDIFFRRRVKLAGDGSGLVYPLFVKDLASGLTAALFMPQSEGQVFYFAGEEITLFSFAKLWADQIGQVKIEFDEKKSPPKLNYQREVDLSKKELGWKINFSHPEAVVATVNWLNRPDVGRLFSSVGTSFSSAGSNQTGEEKKSKKKDDKRSLSKEKANSWSFLVSPEEVSDDKLETESEGLWLSRQPEKKPIEEEASPLIHKIEISQLLQEKPEKSQPNLAQKKKNKPAMGKAWRLVGLGLLSLLIIFSPFLFLIKDLFSAAFYLNKSQNSCFAGRLSLCQEQAQKAQKHFYLSSNTADKLTPLLSFLLGQDNFSQTIKIIALGQEAAEALGYFSESAYQLGQVFEAIINPEKEKEFISLIEAGQQSAQSAYFKLTNVAATSKNLSAPFVKQNLSQLPAIIEGTKITLDSLPLLADFLSYEEQTIILLLQNNMELRPTGGFIGSLAVVEFSSGQLVDFTVKDVYEADGQLKGQVEPPPDLKEYLGEETWYLRDANWSPDFPTTAQQILWFWEKQLDKRADGVVAINLQVAKKVLSALGEVYLPDYQETINAQNLFERAEYHSEIGFFPGSTQKKDFLGSLAFEILETLKRQDQLSASLLTAVQQSFLEEEVMMYFTDPNLEKQVMDLGFDGGIKEAVCQKTSCLSSYLWPIDTNVGANKANFFIKRRLIQRLGVGDNQVSHSLRLTWQNTAQTESWPAGAYKNYWRLYVPSSAVLQEAFLENNSGQRQAIDLGDRQEMGKKVWSYLVEVPINSQVTLEVNYQIKNQFNEDRKRLVYLVQKQPGSAWDEDVTLVSYPANWLPLIVSPEGEVSSGAITYRNFLNRDRLFEFEWGEP
ncbi:MAG: TPR repeat-containing protein [Microgenomates bacterium 39_6]|nr:MAG: TPR repeat-containing protein [Microgenomates bacterium 39_6]